MHSISQPPPNEGASEAESLQLHPHRPSSTHLCCSKSCAAWAAPCHVDAGWRASTTALSCFLCKHSISEYKEVLCCHIVHFQRPHWLACNIFSVLWMYQRGLIHIFWFLEEIILQSCESQHLRIFGFPFMKSVIFSCFQIFMHHSCTSDFSLIITFCC